MPRLLLFSLVIWLFTFDARAADKFDAWINVFSGNGFDIDAVASEQRGELNTQKIEGTTDGKLLNIWLQRHRLGIGRNSPSS